MRSNKQKWVIVFFSLLITGVFLWSDTFGLILNTKIICGVYLCIISAII